MIADTAQPPLRWIATTSQLRPQATNERDFATPFAVSGRGTRELVIEFGCQQGWSPEFGSKHRVRLEGSSTTAPSRARSLRFDWFAPPLGAELNRYITYRNATPEEPS